MKEELKKSLTDLIDETLVELEELRKSRFSAEEISIKGPGANELAGKPVNGKLTEKAEDEKDEDEDKKDEAEKAEDDVEKADGVLAEAEKAEKDEDKKDDEKDEGSPAHEDKEKKLAKELLDMHKSVKEFDTLKKSVDGMEALMKGYVDEKVAPLESKLSTLLDMVTKIAESPVPAKGMSYRGIDPLQKSVDDVEQLSKSEVASKLFELKKSGARVDSTDIARAEMGHDLAKIVSKYNIQ